MANGSFGGGQGTKESPYEIEDLWDYLAIKSNREKGNHYYKLMNDIDMNNYEDYKFEIPSDLCDGSNGVQYFLDGQNHSIKNIIIKDSVKKIFDTYSDNYGELKNIKFENLIFINISDTTPIFKCNNFFNVHIGLFIFDSVVGSLIPNAQNTHDCTFNIRGKLRDNSSMQLYNSYNNLERIHFNFDIFVNNGNSDIFDGKSGYNSTILDNCYFTGKIKEKARYGSNMNTNLFPYFSLKNSYINTDFLFSKNVTNINLSANVTSYSFANLEKFHHINEEEEEELEDNFIFNPSNNFDFLTDAECKDPHGLLERGFPVVPSDT